MIEPVPAPIKMIRPDTGSTKQRSSLVPGTGKTRCTPLSAICCLLSAICTLVSIVCFSETHAADNQLSRPFQTRNDNPLIRIYSIPGQASATLLPKGQTAFDVYADATSHFSAAETASEHIRIDGETHRLTFRIARGIGNNLETGLELPFLDHGGGFLDSVIMEWHDIFGLSQLGRDRVRNGLLKYRYERFGNTEIDITESDAGIGDAIVFFGTRFATDRDRGLDASSIAIRGQVSLPTGDPDQLHGSGAVNAALWLQGSRLLTERWSIWGNGGMSYLGAGDVLPELQRRWAAFGGAGIGWQAFNPVLLKVQLDGQTAVYDGSAFDQLNSPAVQLSFGGTIRLSSRFSLDLVAVENIYRSAATPDFGVSIALRAFH